MKLYEIIKKPILTEKTYKLIEQHNKYTFEVDRKANKTELKKTFAKLFGVTVTSVNLLKQRPRSRTMGRIKGFGPAVKKAVFTLKAGDSIDILQQIGQDYSGANLQNLKAKLDEINKLEEDQKAKKADSDNKDAKEKAPVKEKADSDNKDAKEKAPVKKTSSSTKKSSVSTTKEKKDVNDKKG